MSTSKILNNNTTAIILSAGIGSRMKAGRNKMLLELDGRMIFEITLDKFKCHLDNVILVVSQDDFDFINSLGLQCDIVIGGKTRQESVLNALRCVKTERVLIHDGARALISDRLIDKCINTSSPAYFVALPLKNTIRFDASKNFETLDRSHLLDVQTPQGGNTTLFLDSAIKAIEENKTVTDDISTLDINDIEVINGEETNIKLTTPYDLELFKILLKGDL